MEEKAKSSGKLFLGIPLPEEAKKSLKIQSWPGLSRYKDEGLVPSYNWHLTLAFIGNLNEEQAYPLKQLIEVFDWGKSFKIGIRSFGGFPDISDAKIIWAGVHSGSEQIEELAATVRRGLDSIQIPYDSKPFVPHITLCRMKHLKNLKRLQEDGKMKREISLVADKIVLFESLGRKQPYEIIKEVTLS